MNFNDLQSLSYKDLYSLCKDIRKKLLTTVSKTGGHLSSNLGIVELTVSLLRAFHPEKDDFIFDVGHQCYTYKLLTNRWDKFSSLRQFNGISGYPNIEESVYDSFISGHSGTSLSLAFGFAYAKKLKGIKSSTVAIVGDGSLTSGENYEAINNIVHYNLPVIIILNDNEMSISKNVGSLPKELGRLRNSFLYRSINNRTKSQLSKMGSFGKYTISFLERIKMATKKFFIPKAIFEEFGLTYFGPYNGHNIAVLSEIFNQVKKQKKPCIVHVVTKKGNGISHVENNSTQFHSSPPFVLENENFCIEKSEKTFSDYFGETLLELGDKNNKIVALTAAMSEGLKMSSFLKKYPSRFIDAGIAEQALVTSSAAIAHNGFCPVVGLYSTFLQRAYDQIIHDCCIQSEPVIFAIDRAGAVSSDGPTHQGSFDISFLNPIPHTTIMAPSNGTELKQMFFWASKNCKNPTFIRYPKTKTKDCEFSKPIRFGKADLINSGKDGYLVFLGPFLKLCQETVTLLATKNLDFGIINARFAKPFDKKLIRSIALSVKKIATIEDGILSGGFGNEINVFVNSLQGKKSKVISFGLTEEFLSQRSRDSILHDSGINTENIFKTVLDVKE
ncbi:MAG: 1-deoxy-D-xylulose-5-phosphate synthase [Caldisericia bacterium]|nr:1-deoxy-D-xylulose-5-phosphate synthase [Caldisericia bacterium]